MVTRLRVARSEDGVPVQDEFEGRVVHAGRVLAIAFLGEHRLLLGTAEAFEGPTEFERGAHAVIYDLREQRIERAFPTGAAVEEVARINGDRAVLAHRDGRLGLVDLGTGAVLRDARVSRGGLLALDASPDGATVVVGAADGKAELRDASTLESILRLEDHPQRIWEARYTPDGRRIATACQDGLVRIFDPDTGLELAELRGHENYVHDLAFTPDGSTLLSCSGDGTVRVWTTQPHRQRYRDLAGVRDD